MPTPSREVAALSSAGWLDLEPIGEGGMGRVYAARGPNGQPAVLKTMRQASDERLSERFRREAIGLAQLSHPGIVRIHSYQPPCGEVPAYLVMEHIRGRSLDVVVSEDGPLPVEQAIPIFAQLAEALAYCHKRGVVHRDIKPSNILLDESEAPPRAVLIDFGLVKLEAEQLRDSLQSVADNLTHTQAGNVGTPSFMSPELLVGGGAHSPASDIWALGATMSQALTGAPPYGELEGLHDLLVKANSWSAHRSSLLQALPRELEDLLVASLEREPQDRPEAAELASALRELEDCDLSASRGRSRLALGAALALILLAALGAAFAMTGGPRILAPLALELPALVRAPELKLTGRIEAEAARSLVIASSAGRRLTWQLDERRGFSGSLRVGEGETRLRFVALDASGAPVTKVFEHTVTLDSAPPRLQLEAPPEATFEARAELLLTISEPGCVLRWQGQRRIAEGLTATLPVALEEGENRIVVEAEDRAGHLASLTVTLQRWPTLEVELNPKEGQFSDLYSALRVAPERARIRIGAGRWECSDLDVKGWTTIEGAGADKTILVADAPTLMRFTGESFVLRGVRFVQRFDQLANALLITGWEALIEDCAFESTGDGFVGASPRILEETSRERRWTLRRCVFPDVRSSAVFASAGVLLVEDCVIATGNESLRFSERAKVTVRGCAAYGKENGSFIDGEDVVVRFERCRFLGRPLHQLRVLGSTVSIDACEFFVENAGDDAPPKAPRTGVQNNYGKVEVRGSLFHSAGVAAIHTSGGDTQVTDCEFRGTQRALSCNHKGRMVVSGCRSEAPLKERIFEASGGTITFQRHP